MNRPFLPLPVVFLWPGSLRVEAALALFYSLAGVGSLDPFPAAALRCVIGPYFKSHYTYYFKWRIWVH